MSDKVSHENAGNVVVQLSHTVPRTFYIAKLVSFNDRLIGSTLRNKEVPHDSRHYFVGIPVQDQDVALRFYTECLGSRVVTDRPFTASQRWIELLIPGAETGLALYTPEGHEDRIGQFQSIAFWCDDVFATSDVLKSKGVLFAQELKREPWGSTALIMDPDRNQFALSSKGKQR